MRRSRDGGTGATVIEEEEASEKVEPNGDENGGERDGDAWKPASAKAARELVRETERQALENEQEPGKGNDLEPEWEQQRSTER